MRTALNFAIFLGALVGGWAALAGFTPLPRVEIVSPKIEFLARHGDEFDVLFVGSSRTYRQIIPEIFDGMMAAGGHPVRSFNLGVDGMRPPEDTFVLEHVLAGRSKPLKFVLVESNALRLTEREEDAGTLRAAYWHDWKRTATLFRRAFFTDAKRRNFRDRVRKAAEQWEEFAPHAGYFFETASSTGRGHEALEQWMMRGPLPPLAMTAVGPRQDGYRRSSEPDVMDAAKSAAYAKALAEMLAKGVRVDFADPVSQAELREKQSLAASHGGRLFVVVPPFTASRVFHPEPGPEAPPVFDFCDPVKYPELFAPENHADSGHVNRAGSELYTRHIARRLLEHLNR